MAAVNNAPGVLDGHELILRSVISRDNDSFCNTDQGKYMLLSFNKEKKILLKISLNYWRLIESTYSHIEGETNIQQSKSIFYANVVEDPINIYLRICLLLQGQIYL